MSDSRAPSVREEAVIAAERAVARQVTPGAYRSFVPKAGDHLVVQLPGERIRCPVERVIDTDTVIFRIDSPPMAKSHQFQFDRNYGARRRLQNGRDFWEAQYEREFLAEQSRIVEAEKPRVKPIAAPVARLAPVKKAKSAPPAVVPTSTATGADESAQDKGLAESFEQIKVAQGKATTPKKAVLAKKAVPPITKAKKKAAKR